ncbi:hypothetical protein ACFL6I_24285 [candidate division KSB1 bacterium]
MAKRPVVIRSGESTRRRAWKPPPGQSVEDFRKKTQHEPKAKPKKKEKGK